MSASRSHFARLLLAAAFLDLACGSSKKVDLGDECSINSDCNNPLSCAFGKCHTSCVQTRDCPLGQSCVMTVGGGVCQLASEALCNEQTICATGLLCAVDNHCRAACVTDGNCSAEQKCVEGVCADPGDVGPGGGLVPANPKTDAGVDATSCPTGSETCACYGNDTCNAGLVCASRICVRLGGTGGTGGKGGTGGTAGVPSTDGGQGGRVSDGGGSTSCAPGPGGLCWYLYNVGAATADWAEPPSPSAVHVTAKSASAGNAGMIGVLANGAPVDLSGYDQLWFDATIPAGQRIGVGLGRQSIGGMGCTWDVTGIGTGRYTVDLRMAKFCWPRTCGSSRTQIEDVQFFSEGWSSNYTLDISVTNIGFAASSSVSGSMIAGNGASLGLNGWCWSLFSWSNNPGPVINATTSWKTQPSSNDVEVLITDADTDGNAGCSVDIPEGQTDLTKATYLEFDANFVMTNATRFKLAMNDLNRATCSSDINVIPGKQTYRIALDSINGWCGKGATGEDFNRSKVYSLDFGTPWDLAASADITITRLVIK